MRGIKVCVTGATGFIATELVRQLLERGFAVHATVRDPNNAASTAHLRALPGADDGLRLFKADLLVPGSFHEALRGCAWVAHTASPVKLHARDPQREIVDVAVQGTRNVLQAVSEVGDARRVVVTSSIAAVADPEKVATRTFDESDWNDSASLESGPYPLSKTLAEREAWALERTQPRAGTADAWRLVTVHPVFVMGPMATRAHLRSSTALVAELMRGRYPAFPRLHFNVVDVRDVAAAHIAALEQDHAQGRYLLCAGGLWMREIGDAIRGVDPSARVPRLTMPNLVMWALTLVDKRITPGFLKRHLNRETRVNATRVARELGIHYRDPRESVADTARAIRSQGLL